MAAAAKRDKISDPGLRVVHDYTSVGDRQEAWGIIDRPTFPVDCGVDSQNATCEYSIGEVKEVSRPRDFLRNIRSHLGKKVAFVPLHQKVKLDDSALADRSNESYVVLLSRRDSFGGKMGLADFEKFDFFDGGVFLSLFSAMKWLIRPHYVQFQSWLSGTR